MSPAGSPTAGQVDGQELAMRMIQAAESASLAARLAAEAIQKKGNSDDRAWFRVLPKRLQLGARAISSFIGCWLPRDFKDHRSLDSDRRGETTRILSLCLAGFTGSKAPALPH